MFALQYNSGGGLRPSLIRYTQRVILQQQHQKHANHANTTHGSVGHAQRQMRIREKLKYHTEAECMDKPSPPSPPATQEPFLSRRQPSSLVQVKAASAVCMLSMGNSKQQLPTIRRTCGCIRPLGSSCTRSACKEPCCLVFEKNHVWPVAIKLSTSIHRSPKE